MHIKQIISQHRRDFTALYQCEHCDHEHKASGYDDEFFHHHVIPGMECPKCGEKAGSDSTPRVPKYPEGSQV